MAKNRITHIQSAAIVNLIEQNKIKITEEKMGFSDVHKFIKDTTGIPISLPTSNKIVKQIMPDFSGVKKESRIAKIKAALKNIADKNSAGEDVSGDIKNLEDIVNGG